MTTTPTPTTTPTTPTPKTEAQEIWDHLQELERKAVAAEEAKAPAPAPTDVLPVSPTRSAEDFAGGDAQEEEEEEDLNKVVILLQRMADLNKTPGGATDLCERVLPLDDQEADLVEGGGRRIITTNQVPEEQTRGNFFTKWWARTFEVDTTCRSGPDDKHKDRDIDSNNDNDNDDDDDDNDNALTFFASLVARLIQRIKPKRHDMEPMEYTTYPLHLEYPQYELTSMMKLLEGGPPSQYSFSLAKWIRVVKRAVRPYLAQRMVVAKQTKAASTYEAKHAAIFTKPRIFWNWFPNPYNVLPPPPRHVLKHWDEDEEMARQFLAGLNPVMICVCSNPQQQLTLELWDFFATQQVNVEEMASQQRLLYVSYDDLVPLKHNPHDAYPLAYNEPRERSEWRYFHPAVIVFEVEPTQRMDLSILAIQLDRFKGAPVFSKATTDPHTWTMAKTSVTSADAQIHEWVSHLGNTHLTMEPHIIAIHNTLRRENHPLFVFFEPLVKDTLFLNDAARDTLAKFGPFSFGDVASSVGTGQFMQMIHRRWQSYDFFKSSALPEELASRGFTDDFDLPGYYFRIDGLKLWSAMGTFAENVVAELYPSDVAVKEDAVLQAWAQETTLPHRGAVPGFPTSFTNRQTVARVMQTLMWLCSGLHAAVNFPQYDYMAYTPNKPLSQRRDMALFQEHATSTSTAKNPREWFFRLNLPYLAVAKRVQLVVRLLTLPSETCLDNLARHFNKYPGKGKESYQKFLVELDQLGDEMEARNRQLQKEGKPVYPYLHPSKVPASIDI